MALKNLFTVPAGFDVAGTSLSPIKDAKAIKLNNPIQIQAYCRVDKLIEQKTNIAFDLGYYDADAKKRISSKAFVFVHDMADNAKNYRSQAYNYLKTLDEFSNAVDC
jgi:hypothetical protein